MPYDHRWPVGHLKKSRLGIDLLILWARPSLYFLSSEPGIPVVPCPLGQRLFATWIQLDKTGCRNPFEASHDSPVFCFTATNQWMYKLTSKLTVRPCRIGGWKTSFQRKNWFSGSMDKFARGYVILPFLSGWYPVMAPQYLNSYTWPPPNRGHRPAEEQNWWGDGQLEKRLAPFVGFDSDGFLAQNEEAMVLNYGTLPAIDRNNWKPGIASSTKALCNLKPASPSNIGSSQHGGYTSQGMCCSQTLQDMENYPANIKEIMVFVFSWGWFIVDKQHTNIEITGSNKTRVSK